VPKRTVAHAAHVAATHTIDMPVDRPPDPPELELPAPWEDTKATNQARRASKAKAASTRRRLVDPTTCDLDYSKAQLEFMKAMQDYKQSSGRMYPTWSEVLEVLVGLGYEKSPKDEREHPPRRPA
jgi:hypothetical protein